MFAGCPIMTAAAAHQLDKEWRIEQRRNLKAGFHSRHASTTSIESVGPLHWCAMAPRRLKAMWQHGDSAGLGTGRAGVLAAPELVFRTSGSAQDTRSLWRPAASATLPSGLPTQSLRPTLPPTQRA